MPCSDKGVCAFENERFNGPNCGPCMSAYHKDGSEPGWRAPGTEGVERTITAPTPAASTNPKKALGMKKPPMHLVPRAPLIEMAMAFKDGAQKYGPYNWRIDPVDITTYVAAAQRHLDLFLNGQRNTSDTNVSNLGAVMACCAILLDAEASGTLIDDRPPAQDLEAVMDRYTVGKGLPA